MSATPVATAAPAELAAYLSPFEAFQNERGQLDPPWLAPMRRAALARFAAQGFPTTRQEAWRFTSVAPIARAVFRRSDGEDRARVAPEALAPLVLGPAGARPRVVFVNGRYAPELSSASGLEGVRVESLREALAHRPERLEPHLARIAGEEASVFASLNLAFLDDGAFVEIAPGAVVSQPIQLVFFSSSKAAGDGAPTVSYPRTLVLAGRDSQATIVESYGGPDGEVYFTSAVTEIAVGDGAVLDHYRVQREGLAAFHVATLAVRQERSSQFSNHSTSLGGALARCDIDVLFAAEGSGCTLSGLFMAGGEQHVDTHTLVRHAHPHCSSREVYKGILDGRARGVFHGTIRVEAGAQKTDAYQANKNLLLSREALVNSTPALQIYADDVKCKHGSTTGQLDPAALFYLRSRGLSEEAARSLLVYAFASDLLQRVKLEPLRAGLDAYLQTRLPGAAGLAEAVA